MQESEEVRVGGVVARRRKHESSPVWVWDISCGNEDRTMVLMPKDTPRLRIVLDVIEATEKRMGGDA